MQGVDVTAWREVVADGFRFCVPSSWRASGRTWQHGGASISWGVGSRPARQAATTVVSVPASELGALQAGGAVPDSDVRRFSETIDGRRANLWRNRFGREFHTGAEWSFPRVWLVGDARDAASADLQVAIFRTVRFSAR